MPKPTQHFWWGFGCLTGLVEVSHPNPKETLQESEFALAFLVLMSIVRSRKDMGSASFHEFKKQASFFFKEKIKTARLALTDVTPAQLLTEEATNANPQVPDAVTLRSISRAAFEVDDFWRIVDILHRRFSRFEKNSWRSSYNSLILLEHMLTHGPESSAEEFECDKNIIIQIQSFQFIDEKGFDWGLAVKKKTERILKLLEKGPLLKEERNRARKLTRGIQGFGSFNHKSSSTQSILQESCHDTAIYGRSKSDFDRDESDENQPNEKKLIPRVEITVQSSLKENVISERAEFHKWNCSVDSNSTLVQKKEEKVALQDENHPFSNTEINVVASLLSATD